MFKMKCTVCGTALEGRFLTLKQESNPLSFSEEDVDNFGATNLAFLCGREDCETVVCHRCTAKLEREKAGGFLSKREHLMCPGCETWFGEGGTDLMLEGWFPAEVHMVETELGGHHWVFQMRYKEGPLPAGDLTIPTSICCVCTSETVHQVMRVERRLPNPLDLNQQYALQHTIPLCKSCYSVLTHPSIESPGFPYEISLTHPGEAWGAMDFRCANPTFMQLVKEMNPFLFDWR